MENNYKKIIECFCHECGHNTKHRILFSITKHSEDNDDFWWSTEYCIAECCGCGSITFVTLSNDESNIDYNDDGTAEFVTKYKTYPYQKLIAKEVDDIWTVPSKIWKVYRETLRALNDECFLLAAAGFRMIIEAVCLENNINAKSLESKINMLCKKNIITKRDRDRLHSIRFMGNDSVHLIKSPTREELLLVFEIENIMLENLYILDDKCKGILNGPIKTYEEFEKLLDEGLKDKSIDSIYTLKGLIPKDRRLIHEDLKGFESELQKRIQSKKYTKLSLCPQVTQGIGQQYKIIKK